MDEGAKSMWLCTWCECAADLSWTSRCHLYHNTAIQRLRPKAINTEFNSAMESSSFYLYLRTTLAWTVMCSRWKSGVPEIIRLHCHGYFSLNTKSLDFFSQKINILYKSVIRRSLCRITCSGTQVGGCVHSPCTSGQQQTSKQFSANDQLDALFYIFIYYTSLHVSSITVLIIRRSNCINTSSGMTSLCEWLLGMPVTYIVWNIPDAVLIQFDSPDDEHCDGRNM